VHVNDVTVTAAQKIIKNLNYSYVHNALHIKLVKLQSIQLQSGWICHFESGKIRLQLDWKRINPVQPYSILLTVSL